VVCQVEQERDRWLPWIVVAFAAGAGFYFVPKTEPVLWWAAAAAGLGMLAAISGARSQLPPVQLLCALTAACVFGFAAGKIRAELIAGRVITRDRAR
jgi:competence protein ComEC